MRSEPDHVHREPMPGPMGPAAFEEAYAGAPPWDIGRPQPAFLALSEGGAVQGRVLDVGCGTGEHPLMAAGLGLEATGVDVAANALRRAERKARERGLTARFLRHDARNLDGLGEAFDTVLDCGLFHIFQEEERAVYVASLYSVLAPGGRYLMLGFSDRQPEGWGPHRLAREDVTAAFARGWRLDAIEPATIDVTIDPGGVSAWLVTATRI